MSKIEKTLELKITHEILQLADSFWWFLQPNPLNRYWQPYRRFPLICPPKSFASGLHINLEGRTGGGYDVCINSPSNFGGGKPRLLFMQFKAGVEKQFNRNIVSLFHGRRSSPNIDVEFDINSNTKRDQHRLLQTLAQKVGNMHAVIYVFPRIVKVNQLQDNIGNLLTKTSFISIDEIDRKAAEKNITIDDVEAYKFRTCYHDYSKNEMNYLFFVFGEQERLGHIIGEIFAIRIYRALNLLSENQNSEFSINRWLIGDALIRYLLHIGRSFPIPLENITSFLNEFSYLKNHIERYLELDRLKDYYIIANSPTSESVDKIFQDIVKEISIYFEWVEMN